MAESINVDERARVADCFGCRWSSGRSVLMGSQDTDEQLRAAQSTCARHATRREYDRVESQNKRALRLGLKRLPGGARAHDWARAVYWPYGVGGDVTARDRLLNWMDAEKLKLVDGPAYHNCTRWVRLGRCLKDPDRCPERCDDGGFNHSWADHLSYWRSTDPARPRRVLVSQPYIRLEDHREELIQLAADRGVRLELREDSWYGASSVFVAFWGGAA